MNYQNLFEIINTNINVRIKNIDTNIIEIKVSESLFDKLLIKFKDNFNLSLVIGFSINLKYINLTYKNKKLKIDKLTKININVNINDILEIETQKYNTEYDIYLYILNNQKISYSIFNKNNIKIITNPILNNKINKIIVVLTQYIKSIGEYFEKIFNKQNIDCELIYSLEISDCLKSYNKDDTIYLILISKHKHNLLPKRVIFYQIEQSESKFLSEPLYFNKFKNIGTKAENVWEYTKVSSKLYYNIFSNKIKWKPMPFVVNKEINSNIIDYELCDYDIFFYGLQNARRQKILSELSKFFNIKIGFGCYGKEKNNLLVKSRIILNIHYYNNAGLETCRINEILNYNKIIISEKSPLDIENTNLYSEIIDFVDEVKEDLSNIHLMIEQIKYYLNKDNYLNKVNSYKNKIEKLEETIINMYSDFS